jgi:hypothetical protein
MNLRPALLLAALAASLRCPAVSVYIDGVPDYEWHAGCFGTATGNLIGFYDRNGMPDFYTGPTAGGVAPLDSRASTGHRGIRSLWASEAGVDGRPPGRRGHIDDYYVAYESVADDPFRSLGRTEHVPDCIGDFIGLNQNKWADLNGECRGNIDGYSFVFWDRAGGRRTAKPGLEPSVPAGADIPSGLIDWSRHRGYDAEAFCQLAEFHPGVAAGSGFTFEDMKAEIDAGYPVLLFLQPHGPTSRTIRGVAGVNPDIHGMLAYGYLIDDFTGERFVRFRTSWASGDLIFSPWTGDPWTPTGILNFPLRGVIGYHPRPKIRSLDRRDGRLEARWDGPSATLVDADSGERTPAHRYVVESASSPGATTWTPLGDPVAGRTFSWPEPSDGNVFYRVRLLTAADTAAASSAP